MSRALLLALAVSMSVGCRSGLLPGQGDAISGDDEYATHFLAIDSYAFGIYKRSASRDLCAGLIFFAFTGKSTVTVPGDWGFIEGFVGGARADCLTADFAASTDWPLSASGEVEFESARGDKLPCSLAVHASAIPLAVSDGHPRPAGLVAEERFETQDLVMHGACGE